MHTRELLVDKVRNKAWLESRTLSSAMPLTRARDTLVWHIKQNINFQFEEDLDNAYT
jgi:hypothetical protein